MNYELACTPYDDARQIGCPHWTVPTQPPDRDLCIKACARATFCFDCQRFDRCPIAGLPKILPGNRRALRLYNAVKLGLFHLDLDTLPAAMFDRLMLIDGVISRHMAKLTKTPPGGR